jgi:hypothetical protein
MTVEECFELLHEVVLDSNLDADIKIELDDFVEHLENGEE